MPGEVMRPLPSVDDKAEVTVHQALSEASETLAKHGIEDSCLNAEILLTHLLSCSRTSLHAYPARRIGEGAYRALRQVLGLRLQHVPLQYITGKAPFLHLTLAVSQDVLIPRPETEGLVESVLNRLSLRTIEDNNKVLCDIGTGSGNIAIALACAYPEARVYATDLSPEALAVPRRNAADHHLDNIVFLQGDLCEPLQSLGLRNTFDAIICNPPYIATSEIDRLCRDIRDFEPRLALDGGQDGLCVISRLISEASCFLGSGGLLALEVGQGQARKVAGMMIEKNQYSDMEIVRDLSGIERVVMGTRT